MADTTEQNAIDECSEGDLTRREIIKMGAIAVAMTGLDRNKFLEAIQNKTPLFFTSDEFAVVDELTEMIIPTDDHSPGAREAQVAAYIDFRLSDSFEEEPRTVWRNGLKLIEQLSQEMHGRTFMTCTPEQRVALLTRISQNEPAPSKPEELFFRELKSQTARAYYTSKIGIHNEMEYKGNVSLKEFVGYDAT
jgi:hypothetical protein